MPTTNNFKSTVILYPRTIEMKTHKIMWVVLKTTPNSEKLFQPRTYNVETYFLSPLKWKVDGDKYVSVQDAHIKWSEMRNQLIILPGSITEESEYHKTVQELARFEEV